MLKPVVINVPSVKNSKKSAQNAQKDTLSLQRNSARRPARLKESTGQGPRKTSVRAALTAA